MDNHANAHYLQNIIIIGEMNGQSVRALHLLSVAHEIQCYPFTWTQRFFLEEKSTFVPCFPCGGERASRPALRNKTDSREAQIRCSARGPARELAADNNF